MRAPAINPNLETAMQYVYLKHNGYMKELKPFGKDTVEFMKSVGFLKTGWTQEDETFSGTELLTKQIYFLWNKNCFLKNVIDFFKNYRGKTEE